MTKKKKEQSLTGLAKDTLKLGIVSGVGLGALGAVGAIPGMPAAAGNVTRLAGSGLVLANVGQLAKTGLALPKLITEHSKTKKKTGDKKLDSMLGW